ncbi:MAG: HNH endonuclease, partial [Acidobacteria bacterium]|nr:HNH endonuclease [Acidobacteriota bacterium]
CEAHHLDHWSHGGTTSLDNSALLCSYHHHLVHRYDWGLELRHGHVYFTPPPNAVFTIRGTTTPRRNHYHHPQLPHTS